MLAAYVHRRKIIRPMSAIPASKAAVSRGLSAATVLAFALRAMSHDCLLPQRSPL
jgi:hypothetical protein